MEAGKEETSYFSHREKVISLEYLEKCIISKLPQGKLLYDNLTDIKTGKYIYPILPRCLFLLLQRKLL